jgi:hypothetical protein
MKLTRAERKRWEERFARWHTPAEMKSAVDELHSRVNSDVLFNQAGLNFAFEAWIAAKFATARGVAAVRLIADQWPDIEIRNAAGNVERFEAVEADVPGRERGKEYKETAEKRKRGESTWRHAPEDMQDRSALVELALRAAAKKKVQKRYGGRCSLIIMLNFGAEYGDGAEAIGAILHSATEAASSFEEVWLLWRQDAYLLWRNGERVEVELKQGYQVL